ncbi:MAG TPA: iron uptake transporter deferrochelatase/peroxidase subunit [Candidatus Lustribacter sp.]|nr:iron uptake transporter deferrochelatase/peroxidase subunit [Candidatus Lustribacter sp.]
MSAKPDISRRRMLGLTAGAVVGTGVLAASQAHTQGPAASPTGGVPPPGGTQGPDPTALQYPFRGVRQAGIITPAQDRMHFVALDVVTSDRAALSDLLERWTRAAERMTAGAEAAPGGLVGGGPNAAPGDTGEAYDLPPAGLTITVGYGPSLFDGRFGLATRRPEPLRDLPAFAGDDLDPARSGGDICVQACANDPQVAVHAIRNLVRMGFGIVSVRWSQLGFGRTSSTTRSQLTPRNMFGFKDGTANITADESAELAEHVWVGAQDGGPGQQWLVGGTYLVARRIRMQIEVWDRTPLGEQEQIFGRDKSRGAPLGGTAEFDEVDFGRRGTDGELAIPMAAHIRLAHRSNLDGVRILRRGYNFTDGTDGVGHLDAGLFFVAFCRDAHRQFVPMQRALASADVLNEYIEHSGSAVFACPPGLAQGQDWGSQLLG